MIFSDYLKFSGRNKRCVISCPNCGEKQTESRYSISTNCRSCGHYISSKEIIESSNTEEDGKDLEEHEDENIRMVTCYECLTQQEIPFGVNSAICQKCEEFISLKSFVIKNHINIDIKTRGDIKIERAGTVASNYLTCNDLQVFGHLSGNIFATGNVHLHPGSVIIGKLRCNLLFINSEVTLRSKEAVCTNLLNFKGNSEGNFLVKGKATIFENSVLSGRLCARSMEVKPSASFLGTYETLSSKKR